MNLPTHLNEALIYNNSYNLNPVNASGELSRREQTREGANFVQQGQNGIVPGVNGGYEQTGGYK